MRYKNPVLPGFHPDPSVCRIGDSFYLATSSFQYFPGIPIWKSHNLVDWRLIGYGISRVEQIDLAGTPASRGLFAPTIRERCGRFYLTCTEVDRMGNFIISAENPEGPWSSPYPLLLSGIDPSLFFDNDGTAYLCTGGEVEDSPGIALSIIDPDSGEILEEPRLISRGSGGRWPEGPHLYKRGDSYYLFVAEGGTEYGHMETVFRAGSPWGPYEAYPRNPILSHRDDSLNSIQCVGHGDLVEDHEGNSWLLCLGIRTLGPLLHNLGRETFLTPVIWDSEGWPIVGNHGRIDLEMDGPLPKSISRDSAEPSSRESNGEDRTIAPPIDWRDKFPKPALSVEWSSVRGRPAGMIDIGAGGGLILLGGNVGLSDSTATPAFVGRPQRAFDCTFEATLEFEPESEGSEAGVVAYYDNYYHYEVFITQRSGSRVLCMRKRAHDISVESAALPIADFGKVLLRIAANRERYEFSYECGDSSGILGSGITAALCTEGTWRITFTGVLFGLYCVQGKALFIESSCVDTVVPALYP